MKISLQTEKEKRDNFDKKRIVFAYFPVIAYSKKYQRFKIVWLEKVIKKGVRSSDGWKKCYTIIE